MITTNLEQSKRLNDLGTPQDTYFFWNPHLDFHNHFDDYQLEITNRTMSNKPVYAAYTLSELIEWLGKDEVIRFTITDKMALATLEEDNPENVRSNMFVKGWGKGNTPLDALVALAEMVKGDK